MSEAAFGGVPATVDTYWLTQRLNSNPEGIRIVDASWHMPHAKRNALQEFFHSHIPAAQFFNIEECCDKNSNFPLMLPSPKEFEDYVGALGINNKTHVIVYDNNANFGLFSAARVWWMFRAFGHNLVSVIDGGFPKWMEENWDTTDDVQYVAPEIFKAALNPYLVKTFEEMEKNLKEPAFQIVDCRPSGRYEGTSPEPNPGIKPGHIPNAVNVPFASILNRQAVTKVMKKPEEMVQAFLEGGVDLHRPMTVMCGLGVCSCMVAMAAYMCGNPYAALYDGSWTEWYQRANPRLRVMSAH